MPASYSVDNSRRWVVGIFSLVAFSAVMIILMQKGIIPAPGPDGWDWPGEKGKEWDPRWGKDFQHPPQPAPGPAPTPPTPPPSK